MKERQILAVRQSVASAVNESVNEVGRLLQSIVSGFIKIDIGTLESIEQLNEVLKAPEQFVKNRMIDLSGGSVAVAGLTLNRAKLIELIDLPDTAPAFFVLVADVTASLSKAVKRCREVAGITITPIMFTLIDGQISPAPALNEINRAAGVIYADNDRQVEVFSKLKGLIDLVAEINEMPGIYHSAGRMVRLDTLFVYIDSETYKEVPNPHAIKERIQ